jgi:transcription antitermination factor NusA-like protein
MNENTVLIIENKSTSKQYIINIYRNINEFTVNVEPQEKKETILMLEDSDINKIKNDVQNLESIDNKIVNVISEIVK